MRFLRRHTIKLLPWLFTPLLFSAFCAVADQYRVDYANSLIHFSGEHAGDRFSGSIERWQADIFFDPAALDISQFRASFDTASAKTGDRTYDGTLQEQDWFDVENHPRAEFTTLSIDTRDDGTFLARGELQIRGIIRPLEFVFSFSQRTDSDARLEGKFVIDRLAYQIGFESDPTAEWVSRDIQVTFMLFLTKA